MTTEQKNSTSPVLQVLVMPQDLNTHGTLFGGKLLAWLDQAGAVIAAEHAQQGIMLVGVHDVDFACPSFVGDHVSIAGEITEVGETSISVKLTAVRRALKKPEPEVLATGRFVYVTVDAERNKVPVRRQTEDRI